MQYNDDYEVWIQQGSVVSLPSSWCHLRMENHLQKGIHTVHTAHTSQFGYCWHDAGGRISIVVKVRWHTWHYSLLLRVCWWEWVKGNTTPSEAFWNIYCMAPNLGWTTSPPSIRLLIPSDRTPTQILYCSFLIHIHSCIWEWISIDE